MDNQLKELITKLRDMPSKEAADWLMNTYSIDGPNYGQAIALLPHKSWKRSDQLRLATYYFRKIPFASSKAYEAFASFMAIEALIKTIRINLPNNAKDINLLLYYLHPTLERAAKNSTDRELV